ncbi:Aspartokinase [Planctomycetes bacterium Pan216]|uniref:aspartate kinase n=1 Tax=Kolteria novifilia TaxID=2527975 RepID=A0A518B2W3_9BACT|nr:Aspartokinase [Planctomycetes bacterium Pan216]
MGLVVQKFGGTSVATTEKILAAAKRAIHAKQEGHDVAVVVSARGKTTDELIGLAREIHPDPPARELDMLMASGEQVSIALLAMAIHSLGHGATSLTGVQMGIRTDSIHGKARIREISTERIRQIFADGNIAIIAGFQGADEHENIMTLGRGGSDTTGVAIAAVLEADVCEIYTDVDGIFTTDPRQVPTARKLEQISYDEMLELASAGAGVMHSRSIEFAKKYGVIIHVRNSGTDDPGTIIRPEDPVLEHVVVRGCALAKAESRVTLYGVPDEPGIVHRIFSKIAEAHVIVDMIVQNAARDGRTEVSFTVSEGDLTRTLELMREVADAIGASHVDSSSDIAKVSIVGLGMRTHTGVAERAFSVLAEQGINILAISTSDIKISMLVEQERAVAALAALHEEFRLHEPLPEVTKDIRYQLKNKALQPTSSTADRIKSIVENLPSMEDILVSGVDVDERQGRVTLYGVPDQPGVAGRIFSSIAEAGIAVDMIVQNVGSDEATHLTFTTLRGDLEPAAAKAQAALGEANGQVVCDSTMAKIAVRGVGMRSHVGVALRIFRALSSAGVNINLINTSELHITVVVDQADASNARRALSEAFGLELAES